MTGDRENNNAIRDKLTHSLVSMNLNDSVVHDVKVNSDHCRINSEMSKYFDSANYLAYPNLTTQVQQFTMALVLLMEQVKGQDLTKSTEDFSPTEMSHHRVF